jgi:alanyl-tRNA synthetase
MGQARAESQAPAGAPETKKPRMNGRLYYDRPTLARFDAHIVESLEWAGQPAVVLDQTAFYPTGGGQPHDTGTLRRPDGGKAAVVEVVERETDGAVIHVLDAPLHAGPVEGRIDWERRLDLMQQHSGQHLLSAAFVECCQANTTSFHLALDYASIDLDRAPLSAQDLAEAERLANRVIFENRPVTSRFVPGPEIAALPLRKPVTHPGPVRVVEVASFDCSACGGTHVQAAGEIGLIKVVRAERRGEETRVEFLCGWRALADYGRKNTLLLDLAREQSVGWWELSEAVARYDAELKEARRELRRAHDALLDAEAEALWQAAIPLPAAEARAVRAYLPARPPDELKILAQRLAARSGTMVLLGAGAAGDKGHLVFARSADLPVAMGALLGQACALIGGRGGGRPEFAQGGSPDGSRVEEALDFALQSVMESIRDP